MVIEILVAIDESEITEWRECCSLKNPLVTELPETDVARVCAAWEITVRELVR